MAGRMFNLYLDGRDLIWFPEHGVGYYPVTDTPYDEAYFDKYASYEDSDIGRALNAARVALVNKYTRGDVIDVGIGCGSFIKARGADTYGVDINPAGVRWLNDRGLYRSLYDGVENATFWDSLEHIHNAEAAVLSVKSHVFVSIPVFDSGDHVLRSKHYRKDEHCWYFTEWGFIAWMEGLGFCMLERNRMESDLGRDEITTFVFKRNG